MNSNIVVAGSRRAFTLIELLIVVAIVGLLASLLFTGAETAIDRAREAACQGNLRQLSVALAGYLGDNNETFPGPLSGGQTATYTKKTTNSLAAYLAPYLGLTMDGSTRTNLFMVCPVYKTQAKTIVSYGVATDASDYPFGYTAAGATGQPPKTLPALLAKRKSQPTWLIRDIDQALPGTGSAKAPLTPSHKTMRNYLYLDGSVQAAPTNDDTNAVGS